jgi:hypothetical protein
LVKSLFSKEISPFGAYNLVVVPAVMNGPAGYVEQEPSSAISAKIGHTPVLWVRRRPLQITQVLMLVDSTPACRMLARRFVRLGLWADARVMVLPMARHSVSLFLRGEVEFLRSTGRSVTVLSALDLNFKTQDLGLILQRFPAAVVGHLSYRVGLYFGAVRNDPFAIVAERTPLVLLP